MSSLSWLSEIFPKETCTIRTKLQTRTGQRSIAANLWPLTAHIYHVMIMVTGGFSKKSLLFSEADVRRCSSKQLLLEILQYLQNNIGVGVTF